MLKIAVALFAVAALGGLVMASLVLRGRLAPWALSLLHAALGATALVLTGLVVFGGTAPPAGYAGPALLILIVAALGGFFLATFHLRKLPPPRAAVLAHAGLAVIGFLLLAGTAFTLI